MSFYVLLVSMNSFLASAFFQYIRRQYENESFISHYLSLPFSRIYSYWDYVWARAIKSSTLHAASGGTRTADLFRIQAQRLSQWNSHREVKKLSFQNYFYYLDSKVTKFFKLQSFKLLFYIFVTFIDYYLLELLQTHENSAAIAAVWQL